MRTDCAHALYTIRPRVKCCLFPKLLCAFFKHASYRQSVGTAGFAFAAADTCACFYGEGFIASFCPIGKPVAFEIACKKEHIRDADADGAGGAIVAAAAEIARQFGTDFCYLGIFLIGKGRSVGTGLRLTATRIVFPNKLDGLEYLCGKSIEIEPPYNIQLIKNQL